MERKTGACRVCFNCTLEEGDGECLFKEVDECLISDKINALASVNIKEGDGLPDQICAACLLDLEAAYNFKLRCESTNQVLLCGLHAPMKLEDEPMIEEYLSEDNFSGDDGVEYVIENLPLKQSKVQKRRQVTDLKLICDDCSDSFKSKKKLQMHWNKVHLLGRLKCPSCLVQCRSYAGYNLHVQSKSKFCVTAGQYNIDGKGKNRKYNCKICDFVTQNPSSLDNHLAQHTGEWKFKCKFCPKVYVDCSKMNLHMDISHPKNTTKEICPYCSKEIYGRIKLNKHIRLRHSATRYPCTICNKVLQTKNSLQGHLKRHSMEKPFACDACDRTFFYQCNLNRHNETVHLRTKYVCNICDYRPSQSVALVKHKSKHSSTNVACNVCGAFFENE